MKPEFKIKSKYEDPDIFELSVSAANDLFAGAANCYSTREEIKNLSSLLKGYPKNTDQKINFSTEHSDTQSMFSLFFNVVNLKGDVCVSIKISNIEGSTRKNVVELSFEVEPASIDAFVKEVEVLAEAEVGSVTAILKGKI